MFPQRQEDLPLPAYQEMFLGLDRIETTQLLHHNGVFQYLTGLPSYPNATTLRRFLIRVTPAALPKLRALHDRFLHRFMVRPWPPTRVIFDVDSTVLVVYGKQELKGERSKAPRGTFCALSLICKGEG